ncbi:hypothetical protein D3C77_805480 [compost metagenome]
MVAQLVADIATLLVVERQSRLFQLHPYRQGIQMPGTAHLQLIMRRQMLELHNLFFDL